MPPLIVVALVALNAPALPASSVPPLTNVVPLKVFVPVSVQVLAPVFAKMPKPRYWAAAPYRGRVKRRIRGAAEPQRIGAAERHHVAGDGRSRLQLQRIGAAGESDGKAAAGAAGDRPAIDDSDVRARETPVPPTPLTPLAPLTSPVPPSPPAPAAPPVIVPAFVRVPPLTSSTPVPPLPPSPPLPAMSLTEKPAAPPAPPSPPLNRCPRIIGEVRAKG